MKKVLSLVLVAIMLLGIIPISASAASTPSITVKADKSVISAGTVVTFTVSVSANSNLTAIGHRITYSTSDFEYVANSAVASEIADTLAMVNGNTAGKINYAAAATKKITGAAQTLYTFKLKAKKSTGTVSAAVVEAYVEEGNTDKDITTAVANASTKTISFTSSSNDYIKIRKPSMTSIRYKDGIILHADANKTLPNGSKIEWTTNNSNFKTTASSDGKTFKIVSNSNGNTTITATLYSSSGSVLEVETIEMTSKAGFGDKIGGFFRSLFGATKVHAE